MLFTNFTLAVMIFGGSLDENQWRYCSREQAETGHIAAGNLVKNTEVHVGQTTKTEGS